MSKNLSLVEKPTLATIEAEAKSSIGCFRLDYVPGSQIVTRQSMSPVQLDLQPSESALDLLKMARLEISAGQEQLQLAAEHIAAARDRGATQRQIAAEVGKSAAWVNRLLQWRESGYREETPFGPQSKASRARHPVQSAERTKLREHPRRPAMAKVIEDGFDGASRELLVKALGALGSESAMERAGAAAEVEDYRKKLGLTWDQLIIAAHSSLDDWTD